MAKKNGQAGEGTDRRDRSSSKVSVPAFYTPESSEVRSGGSNFDWKMSVASWIGNQSER